MRFRMHLSMHVLMTTIVAIVHAVEIVVIVVIIFVCKACELLRNRGQNRLALGNHLLLVRLDLLLLWHKNHAHATTVESRRNLDFGEIGEALNDVVHAIVALGAERHLTTTEVLNDLHAMAFDEESTRLCDADADIVWIDFHRTAQANFLHFGSFALGLVRFFLLRLLILELAEVHDLAHGRTAVGRDLDEVKTAVVGATLCFVQLDNAQHFAFGIKKSNG